MKTKDKNKILVVVAHPDDELLGLAGTLCKHRDRGDDIHILILANGEDSRAGVVDSKKRFNQAKNVANALKAKLYLEDLPDNQLDSLPLLSIVKIIEKIVLSVNPEIIYTHHAHDLNIDHRLVCEAVLTACRPVSGSTIKQILCFETLSSTEWQIKDFRQFSPNYYVDVSNYLEEKKKLLKNYDDEMRPFPYPRSYEGVEILAKYRGMEIGVGAAEAFNIIRILQ